MQIDNITYNYKISKISEELCLDESFNNYKYIKLGTYVFRGESI